MKPPILKTIHPFFRSTIFLNSFLLGIIAIIFFIYDYDSGNFSRRTADQKYFVYLLILFHYLWILFHNTILLNKYLLKKKYFLYAILFIPCITALCFTQYYIFKHQLFTRSTLTATFLNTLYKTLFWTALYLAFRYLIDSRNHYRLESLKREIELAQLKMQLNPHFLFNALNNIYSYTLESNRYGSELIIKLSELMRYIVEVADKEKIPLNEELHFLENYITFEKERLGKRCKVNYQCKTSTENLIITPLLLFPFVENAFKYGANSIHESSILITIEETNSTIDMKVSNSIVNRTATSTKKGLLNVQRQLELSYPNRYTLQIEHTDICFNVHLSLQLKV
jgi:two-component system LytT family sensor kinase